MVMFGQKGLVFGQLGSNGLCLKFNFQQKVMSNQTYNERLTEKNPLNIINATQFLTKGSLSMSYTFRSKHMTIIYYN